MSRVYFDFYADPPDVTDEDYRLMMSDLGGHPTVPYTDEELIDMAQLAGYVEPADPF